MQRRRVVAAAAVLLSLGVLLPSVVAGGASARTVPHASPKYVYGLNSYVAFNCVSPSVWNLEATNQVNSFKALGATSIALDFPLYTDSITSNNIYAKSQCGTNYQSPTPAQLATIVADARAVGLSVFLRPTLDQSALKAENPTYWHGNIRPASVPTWFANYTATLTPYLKMAQTDHVASFALSSELSSMYVYSNWNKLIAAAKKLYKGTLVITDSWATNGEIKWWSGTNLGIDTYRPAGGATPTWSPTQLLNSWDSTLKQIPVPKMSSATIDEIGIPAQVGTYAGPNGGNYPLSTNPFDQQIQVNWFTMACAFMKTHNMKGIYFWGALLNNSGGNLLLTPNEDESGNFQPETQTAIKNCFGVGSKPTVSSLSPKSGPPAGGTTVTINGKNFIGALNVMIGTTPATSFVVNSDTQIVAVVPKRPKGSDKVSVITEQGTSATGSASTFTYT